MQKGILSILFLFILGFGKTQSNIRILNKSLQDSTKAILINAHHNEIVVVGDIAGMECQAVRGKVKKLGHNRFDYYVDVAVENDTLIFTKNDQVEYRFGFTSQTPGVPELHLCGLTGKELNVKDLTEDSQMCVQFPDGDLKLGLFVLSYVISFQNAEGKEIFYSGKLRGGEIPKDVLTLLKTLRAGQRIVINEIYVHCHTCVMKSHLRDRVYEIVE